MLTRSTSGGSELTEIGRRVAQTAAAVDHQLARLAEDVGALRAGRTGRVVLGTVSTAKYFAPHLVQRLRATLPGIEVQLRGGNRQSVIEGMKVPGLPIMRNRFLVHRAGHPLSPTERKLHDAILGLRGMLAT